MILESTCKEQLILHSTLLIMNHMNLEITNIFKFSFSSSSKEMISILANIGGLLGS